jgi:hypothetical protein
LPPAIKRPFLSFLVHVYAVDSQVIFFDLIRTVLFPELREMVRPAKHVDDQEVTRTYWQEHLIPFILKHKSFFKDCESYVGIIEDLVKYLVEAASALCANEADVNQVISVLAAAMSPVPALGLLRTLRHLARVARVGLSGAPLALTPSCVVTLLSLTELFKETGSFYVDASLGSTAGGSSDCVEVVHVLLAEAWQGVLNADELDVQPWCLSLSLAAILRNLMTALLSATGFSCAYRVAPKEEHWLRHAEAQYQPMPINTAAVDLPEDIENLVEKLAKRSHEIWAMAKLASGWVAGPDRSKQQHPLLIAYEDLDGEGKEGNRQSCREQVKAILSFGWRISLDENHAQILDSTPSELLDSQTASTDQDISTASKRRLSLSRLRKRNMSRQSVVDNDQSGWIPQPLDLSNTELSKDVMAIQQLLAEQSHEVWASAKLQAIGREQAEQLDDFAPYDSLTAHQKQYDLESSAETLKHLLALGYTLKKRKIPSRRGFGALACLFHVLEAQILGKTVGLRDASADLQRLQDEKSMGMRDSVVVPFDVEGIAVLEPKAMTMLQHVLVPTIQVTCQLRSTYFSPLAVSPEELASQNERDKLLVLFQYCMHQGTCNPDISREIIKLCSTWTQCFQFSHRNHATFGFQTHAVPSGLVTTKPQDALTFLLLFQRLLEQNSDASSFVLRILLKFLQLHSTSQWTRAPDNITALRELLLVLVSRNTPTRLDGQPYAYRSLVCKCIFALSTCVEDSPRFVNRQRNRNQSITSLIDQLLLNIQRRAPDDGPSGVSALHVLMPLAYGHLASQHGAELSGDLFRKAFLLAQDLILTGVDNDLSSETAKGVGRTCRDIMACAQLQLMAADFSPLASLLEDVLSEGHGLAGIPDARPTHKLSSAAAAAATMIPLLGAYLEGKWREIQGLLKIDCLSLEIARSTRSEALLASSWTTLLAQVLRVYILRSQISAVSLAFRQAGSGLELDIALSVIVDQLKAKLTSPEQFLVAELEQRKNGIAPSALEELVSVFVSQEYREAGHAVREARVDFIVLLTQCDYMQQRRLEARKQQEEAVLPKQAQLEWRRARAWQRKRQIVRRLHRSPLCDLFSRSAPRPLTMLLQVYARRCLSGDDGMDLNGLLTKLDESSKLDGNLNVNDADADAIQAILATGRGSENGLHIVTTLIILCS